MRRIVSVFLVAALGATALSAQAIQYVESRKIDLAADHAR